MSLSLLPDTEPVETVEVGAKVYLNGFPKSGLHLAALMASQITSPWIVGFDQDGKELPKPKKLFWCGNFIPAWSTNWRPFDDLRIQVENQPEGSFMQGHLGYTPEIERMFYENGQAFGFVYRDLRDVAVSATYHIEDDRVNDDNTDMMVHPGKAEFMDLPSHEDRLMAVICGLNEWPGLFDRWELYAPWLDIPWVFPIRYEWMIQDPRWQADLFIRYALGRAMDNHELEYVYPEDVHSALLDKTVEMMGDPSNSNTFRKGGHGGWRDEFTPEIKEAFKERAGDWLILLDYEKGHDW